MAAVNQNNSFYSMKRIRIVDDEPIVMDVLKRILSRLGYNTVSADSGECALKEFARQLFDIVMIDVLMPKMNGFEIAQEIRRKRKNQKIVMVTGLGPFIDRYIPKYKDSEMDSILTKPFTFNTVKSVVEEVSREEKVKQSQNTIPLMV
jgi:CheY-like chemotaxis protein